MSCEQLVSCFQNIVSGYMAKLLGRGFKAQTQVLSNQITNGLFLGQGPAIVERPANTLQDQTAKQGSGALVPVKVRQQKVRQVKCPGRFS